MPHYPSKNDLVNRELCDLLSNLQSPTVVAKTMPLLEQPSPPPTEAFGELLEPESCVCQAHRSDDGTSPRPAKNRLRLRAAKRENRLDDSPAQAFFSLLRDASRWSGGASFEGYLDSNRSRRLRQLPPTKSAWPWKPSAAHKPFVAPSLPKPVGPGRDRTTDEVVNLAEIRPARSRFQQWQKNILPRPAASCATASAATANRPGPI